MKSLKSYIDEQSSNNLHIDENLFDQEILDYKINKWFEHDADGFKQFNDFISSVKDKHIVNKDELSVFYTSMNNGPKFIDFICDNTVFGDVQRDYMDSLYNIVKFCADV